MGHAQRSVGKLPRAEIEDAVFLTGSISLPFFRRPQGDAQFILLVEKDAVFMRLSEDRFYNDYPWCVLCSRSPVWRSPMTHGLCLHSFCAPVAVSFQL